MALSAGLQTWSGWLGHFQGRGIAGEKRRRAGEGTAEVRRL
jgi:hypothetical protein